MLTPHRYTPRHPELDPIRQALTSPLLGLVPVAVVVGLFAAHYLGLA